MLKRKNATGSKELYQQVGKMEINEK